MEQATNQFTKGLQCDTHPMVLSNDTLTDCLNGTIVTMSGNEVVLLNDMGNRRVDNAFLPPGYEPVGMKEYGGIIYVAAYNPVTNHSQVGSFPSPERKLSASDFNDEDLKAEFNFNDRFYGSNNIEPNEDYGIDFLKNDSFLIPLTKDLNLHVGDKFTVYAAGLSNMKNRITNYKNTITDEHGKKWVLTPKNKEFTLQLGILNSLNEFADITKSLARWKDLENSKPYITKELVFGNEESIKVIKVDSNTIISLTVNANPNSKLYSSFNGNSWSEFSENIIIPERITKLYLKGQNITITDIRNNDSDIKEWEIINYTNESELYKFNDGYFIPDEFTNPTLEETKKDAELIKERQTFATNTYAYKLVGPLYLKVTLNHILSCDYSVDVKSIENNLLSLTVTSNIKYNCPDGTQTILEKDSIGEYYTRDLNNPTFEQKIKLLNHNINYDNYIATTCVSTLNRNNLDLVSNFTQESGDNDSNTHYGRVYLDSEHITVKKNNERYYFYSNKEEFYINIRNNKCSIVINTSGAELDSLKFENNSITKDIPFIKIKQVKDSTNNLYYYTWGVIMDYDTIEEFHRKEGINENEETKLIFITNGNLDLVEFRNSLSVYIRWSHDPDSFETWANLDKYFYGNIFGEFNGKYLMEINSNTKYITDDSELDTERDFYPGESRKDIKVDLRMNLNYIKTDISSYSLCYEDPSPSAENSPNALLNTLYFPIKTIENLETTPKFQIFDINTTSPLLQIKSDFRAHYIPNTDNNPEITEINIYKLKENSFIYNNIILFHIDEPGDVELLSYSEMLIDSILIGNQEYLTESITIHINDTYILNIDESDINIQLTCLSNEENPEIQPYYSTKLDDIISSERIIENIDYDYISNLYSLTLKNRYIITKGSNYLDLLLGIPLINSQYYLHGSVSKISVNLDLVKTNVVNIYHWSTKWENSKLYLRLGINNYTKKPISEIKFLLKEVGNEQNLIEYTYNHTFTELSTVRTICIENILSPNCIYIIERILYRFIEDNNFFNIEEYQNRFDEYGNKIPIQRWIITTDLFNEFYFDITDYCTLYKTRNAIVNSFRKKMELDFEYNLNTTVNATEELDNNLQSYNFTQSNIKVEYPTIDKNSLQLKYLNNYPSIVENLLTNNFIDSSTLTLSDLNISINGIKYQLVQENSFKLYTIEDIDKYLNNKFLDYGNIEQKEILNKNTFVSVDIYNNNSYIFLSCIYRGNHTTPSSLNIVRYYDPISKIIKYLGPESIGGKYACLIPDTHERGGDDYHYLIVCLLDNPQGEVKGYSETGTEQYQYLDKNKYYRENDRPEVFYFHEVLSDLSNYLNSKLPENLIYTYMDMKGIKAFNYNSNNEIKYYYFDSFVPRLTYLKDKSGEWFVSKNGDLNWVLYSNVNSFTYFLSHESSDSLDASPDYKSDNNWACVNPFKFKLFGVSTITLKFNGKDDPKSIFSYGTLNFKIKDFTNVSNFNININFNDKIQEEVEFGNTLYNKIKPSKQIEYKIWDTLTNTYKPFSIDVSEKNIHKLLYKYINNIKFINGFYVYNNDPNHKLNVDGLDFNTFVYDCSNLLSAYGFCLGGSNVYYGLAYYNDEDSITRLLIEDLKHNIKNGDVQY